MIRTNYFKLFLALKFAVSIISAADGMRISMLIFLNMCAPQVAAVSGDARRCLDICRRAIEIADSRSKKKGTALVGMSHVDEALQDMFSSPKIRAMM